MDINIVIGIVLALISFGIGSSLRFIDFAKVIRYPRSLTIGLLMQMIFLPLFTFGILLCTNIPADFKFGIMILALCPGGTTSNFISYLMNLETALSVLLTSINSLLILITIPLGIEWFSGYFLSEAQVVQLPVSSTLLQVLLVILVPAFVGLIFNYYFPKTAERLQKPIKVINLLLLASVFAIKFFAAEDQGGTGISGEDIKKILPILLGIHLAAMFISYYMARQIIKDKRVSITIGVEVGLQNTTLALLIAGAFATTDISKPALVFALFSFFTTIAFSYFSKKYAPNIRTREK